jgi:hypothetical protein
MSGESPPSGVADFRRPLKEKQELHELSQQAYGKRTDPLQAMQRIAQPTGQNRKAQALLRWAVS